MKKWLYTLCFCALLIWFCLPPLALAESASPDTEVLEELERLSAGIETLSSDFIQEKYLAVFEEVMLSRGRFYFKQPDSLRWELTEPVATGFVLQGDEGRRWHQRTGSEEHFDIDREPIMKIVAEQLFAWAGADFSWLRQNYRIAVEGRAPVRLRLEPLFETGGFLDHLQIQFAASGRHVQIVELHEADGDFTRLRFENTRINQPLTRELF